MAWWTKKQSPAPNNSGTLGVWKYNSEGDLHCSKCGMTEPDSLPKRMCNMAQKKSVFAFIAALACFILTNFNNLF